MTATLEQLIQVRSQLAEEMVDYLDGLAERAAELPKYYPAHLRAAEEGKTPFDDIRQMVQVVEDRSAFERWMAEEQERMRAAGQDFDRIAYKPKRSLMEEEESDERDRTRRDRPAPPPPFQWDENAGSRFKRAVILGDPGFGKTWLLRYEARRLARAAAEQLRHHLSGFDQITLPIFVRFSELNQSDNPIEDALVEAVGAGRSAAFRHLVREKLATERCVILLDAWDEVQIEIPQPGQPVALLPHHRQRLGQRLDAFAREFTQPRLLLASRIVGYDQSPIPDSPQEKVKELELLAFDTPQIESFVRVWFDDDNDVAQQFLAMLRQNHQVRGLARIPLMLALMCRAYQEKQLAFPTRRVELYDRCLHGLLRDWKIDDKGHEREDELVSEAYIEAMIELLQAVSYELFVEGYEQFSPSLLREKMQQWLEQLKPGHELYGRTATSLIAELKHDGLIIIVGEHRNALLLFLHRTFHEYLTACHLACKLEPSEQEKGQENISKHCWKLVDKKAWHPAWQEVIILLAGKLNNPVPLLKLLASRRKDDYFRHRLALAFLCVPEVPSTLRVQCVRLVGSIVNAGFSSWSKGRFPHATRCFPVIAQASPDIVLPCLIRRLCDQDRDMYWIELIALVGMEEVAASYPEVIPILVEFTLRDKDNGAAANALGQMKPAAASVYDMLSLLVERLRYERSMDMHWMLLIAVLGREEVAANYPVWSLLVESLRDERPVDTNTDKRERAAFTMWKFGPEAASHPEVIPYLTEHALRSPRGRYSYAVMALGRMGPVAANHPYVLPRLVRALRAELHSKDSFRLEQVIEILKVMGPAAVGHPEVLPLLLNLFSTRSGVYRRIATEALGRLGPNVASHPEVIQALTEAALNGNQDALDALGHMGPSAAGYAGVLQLFVNDLEDLRGLGDYPGFLQDLVNIFRGQDDYRGRLNNHKCERAAYALGQMGPVATSHPDVLPLLVNALRHQSHSWPAHVLGHIGPAAASHPDVLPLLIKILRGWHDGTFAVYALRQMAPVAANHPEVVPLLLKKLKGRGNLNQNNKDWHRQLISGTTIFPRPKIPEKIVCALNNHT